MMITEPAITPTVMVIFGGAGDLAWRKLVPSIFSLFADRCLPNRFALIGVDLKPLNDGEYHNYLRQGADRFSRRASALDEYWKPFTDSISYIAGDFTKPELYQSITQRVLNNKKGWGRHAANVFYLAVPPRLIPPITDLLGKSNLAQDRDLSRIVVEKPFGRDLATARVLNCLLLSVFKENQIYRIDHFLGKETVQNILAFRFANAFFEPTWDRRYIDSVQVTVSEQLGVEHRGAYYERAGALRDMVQNHLLQLVCMVAMEPPLSFNADEIRDKKLEVLKSIMPIPKEAVGDFAVRGQYGEGKINDQKVPAYRSEPAVDSKSTTETFAAIKFLINNWRWQGVPFYLRTGKRMAEEISEISIVYHDVPHHPFPKTALVDWQPDRLAIRINPREGILFRFQAKHPGQPIRLVPVDMLFDYHGTFRSVPPEPYEILLLDVCQGDPTLFMRADQIEAAWAAIDPILDAWEMNRPEAFPNYPAGSWGPPAADGLLVKDGRAWLTPTALDEKQRCI